MKDYISERAITIGRYMVEHRSTVRSAAKKFGISKSTVHTEEAILKLFIWKWCNSAPFDNLTKHEIFRYYLYYQIEQNFIKHL